MEQKFLIKNRGRCLRRRCLNKSFLVNYAEIYAHFVKLTNFSVIINISTLWNRFLL
jgi:hypothetical protein